MQPLIFDIHRMSAHDGPGLRTVVFFKGCPLRCRWCHNPEGLGASAETWLFPDKCIGCGMCADVCPSDSISFDGGIAVLDRGSCTGCGVCAEVCPSRALQTIGRGYAVEELMKIIMREKPFMDECGGGLTLSGGEALMFPDYARELLKSCRDAGIHTAVDTCGAVPWRSIEAVLPYTNLFLYDLKIMDEKLHLRHTGHSNEKLLANLIRLSGRAAGCGFSIIIRTPLIPGVSGTAENIRAAAAFIADSMPEPPLRWELCSFNPLAAEKYKRLGMEWEYSGGMISSEDFVQGLRTEASEYFDDEQFVQLSGITGT